MKIQTVLFTIVFLATMSFNGLLFGEDTDTRPPLAIKGIQVDKDIDCEHFREIEWAIMRDAWDTPCEKEGTIRGSIDFIGQPAHLVVLKNLDSARENGTPEDEKNLVRKVQVTTGQVSFDKIVKAFTKKYGKAEIVKYVVRNGFGTEYEQVLANWTQGEVELQVMKHGEGIDEAAIILTGKTDKKELEYREKDGLDDI